MIGSGPTGSTYGSEKNGLPSFSQETKILVDLQSCHISKEFVDHEVSAENGGVPSGTLT